MSEPRWLHDENGNIRRELYSMGDAEIQRLALEDEAKLDHENCDANLPKGTLLFMLRPGDRIRVAKKYEIGKPTDGWLTLVRLSRTAVNGPHLLCTGPHGGGWITPSMVVAWERPE